MKTRKNLRQVAELLELRAYQYTCTFKTAWEMWFYDIEKQGFDFETVKRFILENRR